MANAPGNTPEGAEFLQQLEVPTFRRAMVGDKAKLNAVVYNVVGEVDRELQAGLATVAALSKDETKTPVAQEEAKKKIADRLIAIIERSHDALMHGAARLEAEASAIVKERFAPDPDKTALYAEMRAWFREAYARPGGIMEIRDAITSNSDFATVAHNAPYQLLGMPIETFSDMQMAGLKTFASDAQSLIEDSRAIARVAKNYPEVAQSVRASFYNPVLAMRAASRVEA
ncbi:hypothetical protein [Sphingomonas sp.]|jgi:hypothetical protein|uniref:hypothetical protein n=1 Tax=Sphingomonas sp. TaxID=28214 RepID=UPI002D7F0977|nr:hypothetical protein [Sphingomonas sp.]HEU0044207.1 hypothetical protein [Sphingomonas sp.]